MKTRQLAVPALGALLAFGVVGCSSDNSAALNDWAKGVCSSAKDPIAQANAALADTGQVKEGEAPADLQKRLSADIANLARTNKQIAEAVDRAGAPKIDKGADVQKDAVAELNKAATGYLGVQKNVDALSTSEQAKFADGLKSVGDQVQQLAQLSSTALGKLQKGELGTALAKQPGCKNPSPAAPGSASPGGSPAASATGGSPAASGGAPTGAPVTGGSAGASPAAASGAPAKSPEAPSSGSPSASDSASPSGG